MDGLTLASPSVERRRRYSPWREAWRRFRRHRLAVVSAFLLAILIVAVIAGPFIWRVSINDIDFTAGMQGPSLAHPFGTDDLGQDLLARMIYGGRISLAVGLAAMLVSVVVGTLVGALAGMSRGALGYALMWLTDLFLSLPQLPLLLLLIYLFRDGLKSVFGPEVGIFILIVVVIGGLRWMPVARLVRAQFLSLREKEFVEAARALGASPTRQIVRHILPNALGPVIIAGTIDVAAAIIAESTLSFLGLGFPPDTPTWGRLLYRRQGLSRHRPALGAVSRRRDLHRGGRDQFHRRRTARRARCAAGDLMRPLARNQGFAHALLHRRRHRPGRRRRRHHHQQGRDPVRGRRVRLRQDRHGDVDPEADRDAAGPHRRRRDLVGKAATSFRSAATSWTTIRAKEIGIIFQEPMTSLNPVSRSASRSPRACAVTKAFRARHAIARTVEMLQAGADPQCRRARARLSAPVLRRHAPARDDRDGAGLQAQAR